jgi:hypothetical protein
VTIFDARGKLQNVAAGRIGNFDARGGFRQFSRAARVLEVIEDRLAEHVRSMPRARIRRNATPQLRASALRVRHRARYVGVSA